MHLAQETPALPADAFCGCDAVTARERGAEPTFRVKIVLP